MQHYELMILVSPAVADSDLEGVLAKVKKTLTDAGATITKEESLGKRKLGYPIKHLKQGYYHVYEIDCLPAAIITLDKTFRLMNELLRHMMIVAKVRSQAELDREQAIREKIEARRHAAMAEATAKAQPVKPKEPEKKVSLEELDEKLEKILEEDVMK